MDLKGYLEPADEALGRKREHRRPHFAEAIQVHTAAQGIPPLEGAALALLGVPDGRRAVYNPGCGEGLDLIRSFLYELYPQSETLPIVDLGNLKKGETPEDTYAALASVFDYLRSYNIIPLVIGGSQDLIYGMYLGYEKNGPNINLVDIDRKIDLGEGPGEIDHETWLSKVILRQPSILFNYTHLGYQSYLVDPAAITLMKNMLFDVYRLGQINTDLKEAEPLIRNADMVTVDISSIRGSDAPGSAQAGPHGFYGEEMCQLVRFAGMSDKVSSLGIFEYNPTFDVNGRTAHLIAQLIWFFIDGFLGRTNDFPRLGQKSENHMRYFVKVEGHNDELVFYRSRKTDRWWMEIPCPEHLQTKYFRHILVPCSVKDYQTASSNELPDRYWQYYQKFM
ncbi:MAG: formimidoylglutamase [Bacteroidales bacterium]